MGTLDVLSDIGLCIHVFFNKKPVYKQPSTNHAKIEETFRTTAKELRNFRNFCAIQKFGVWETYSLHGFDKCQLE